MCVHYAVHLCGQALGYWHHRADMMLDNPPQGNQESLMVKNKVAKPLGELGGEQVHGM